MDVCVQFLIGYNRGLIVLWDNKENKTEQTYNATQVGFYHIFCHKQPILIKVDGLQGKCMLP